MELEEGTSISGQHEKPKILMSILHEGMEFMLDLLKGCGGWSFKLELKGNYERQCVPPITSYCSNIPKGKENSFEAWNIHGKPVCGVRDDVEVCEKTKYKK